MSQGTVVGQQEQSFGVLVQTPYGIHVGHVTILRQRRSTFGIGELRKHAEGFPQLEQHDAKCTAAGYSGTVHLVNDRAIAERVPGWAGRVATIEALTGGITNRNLKVTLTDGSRYVLRLCGKDTDLLGIDRHVELAANTHAFAVGIAPEPVAFVEPEGYLVTRFIDADPMPDLRVDDVMTQVGSILRQAHAGPALATSFGCFTIAQRYAATARSRGVEPPNEYAKAVEVCAHIFTAFAIHSEPDVPAHNDLLNANFLRSADGKVWLIDWEYAGMNSRWFDLGNLATNNELDGDGRDALLQSYSGGVDPVGRAKIILMQVMSDIREAMWGVVQQAISTLDVDYVDYAAKHFDRVLQNANSPRFAQALATVAG
jgi:thiamine kinase-like enzyme